MDADSRMIPLTEDDQGEGIRDFVDRFDLLTERAKQLTQKEMDKSVDERIAEIQDKLDALHNLLMRIFGNYILIDGLFIDITQEIFKPE